VAAPLAQSKPFKFGVTISGRTLYLTETTDATETKANGVDCFLTEISANNNKISCGKNNQGFTLIEAHPANGAMKPVANATPNRGWSIGSDNVITWKTDGGQKVHFSTFALGSAKQVYAEMCSTKGHGDGVLFSPGVAKAYFE
jgi:hypothetical protein